MRFVFVIGLLAACGGTTTTDMDFDTTIVARVGFQLAAGAGSGPWADPTIVYVDSITVTGGPDTAEPWTFDASGDEAVLVIDPYSYPGAPPGTEVTWLGPWPARASPHRGATLAGWTPSVRDRIGSSDPTSRVVVRLPSKRRPSATWVDAARAV